MECILQGLPRGQAGMAVADEAEGQLVAQVVDSLSGDLMDEFVLTKPADWRPDQGRQLHTLALFHRCCLASCASGAHDMICYSLHRRISLVAWQRCLLTSCSISSCCEYWCHHPDPQSPVAMFQASFCMLRIAMISSREGPWLTDGSLLGSRG